MKGWIYVVNCPEDWSNTAGGYNYQILDAPHVMAQNKDPKWECVECGTIISGLGLEPGICWKCELATSFTINLIEIERLTNEL
jgi:hypothetical protein